MIIIDVAKQITRRFKPISCRQGNDRLFDAWLEMSLMTTRVLGGFFLGGGLGDTIRSRPKVGVYIPVTLKFWPGGTSPPPPRPRMLMTTCSAKYCKTIYRSLRKKTRCYFAETNTGEIRKSRQVYWTR